MARRATHKPQNILITGASRGLGAAIAEKVSEAGVTLTLWGRDESALEAVAEKCRKKRALVRIQTFDISDVEALKQNFDVASSAATLDCIVVNAGLFDGAREPDGLETLPSELAILDVNLRSAIALGHLATQHMLKEKTNGQIVFISSIAATFPLADAAGYSASKAGISAYATALREKLAPAGIMVTDIQPGHIKTDMAAHHAGSLPMIMETEEAAQHIANAIEKRKAFSAFPILLYLAAKLTTFLPWRVTKFLSRGQRFHIKKSD